MVYLRINELLKEKNKSKYWLIKNMEGSYQVISRLINNETIAIHFDTIDKICDLLDCEPGDLFKKTN